MLTRAIVLARTESCLRMLAGRSWLHHVVEQLVLGGVREVDVRVDANDERVERELEGEERWGAVVRCHYPPHRTLESVLEAATAEPEIVLADASVLVAANDWAGSRPVAPLLEVYHAPTSTRKLQWTGWCRGAGRIVAPGVADGADAARLDGLFARASATTNRLCTALAGNHPSEILEANRAVLSGLAPWVMLRSLEAPAGVWLERGVEIHATARLIPPVYLGELARVGPGALVGPNAVLGAGCVVEDDARVRDSVLPAATYVAPGTRAERVVGLRPGFFRTEAGEEVSAELARALIALDAISVGAALRAEINAALMYMLEMIEAPARRARELMLAWARPGHLKETV